MNIYMAVDLEYYELPYAVADTAEELAKMCGVTKNNVYSAMSHVKNGRAKRSRYVKVEVEDESDDEFDRQTATDQAERR